MRFGAKKFYSNFALPLCARPAAFKKKRIKIEKIKANERILRPRGRKKPRSAARFFKNRPASQTEKRPLGGNEPLSAFEVYVQALGVGEPFQTVLLGQIKFADPARAAGDDVGALFHDVYIV